MFCNLHASKYKEEVMLKEFLLMFQCLQYSNSNNKHEILNLISFILQIYTNIEFSWWKFYYKTTVVPKTIHQLQVKNFKEKMYFVYKFIKLNF